MVSRRSTEVFRIKCTRAVLDAPCVVSFDIVVVSVVVLGSVVLKVACGTLIVACVMTAPWALPAIFS